MPRIKKKRKPGRPPKPASLLSPIGRLMRELRGPLSLEAAAAKVGKIGMWWHDRESGKCTVNAGDITLLTRGFGVEWRCAAGVHRFESK